MKINVHRRWFSDVSTVGEMYLDGEKQAFTLEDTIRRGAKVQGKTAIPAGVYEVIINFSDRFQRPMPLLLGVPDFTGIRIHCGNTDKDTEGCLLVGKIFDPKNLDFIGESRAAFDDLYVKLDSALKTSKVLLEIR